MNIRVRVPYDKTKSGITKDRTGKGREEKARLETKS